jgi:hypothetical protein
MRKNIIKLHEEINRINELSGVGSLSGKHLVVVDIQPEYMTGFKGFFYNFISFLNNNHTQFSEITFLYNGSDTVGELTESEYKMWLLDNELNEEVLDTAMFYDKGYAFFRYCIDSGIDDDEVVNLVKFMVKHVINDSRELTQEFWDGFIKQYVNKDIRELLEISGDCINIPELMDELKNYGNILLCGGGINECLKEVEIALKALGKNFNLLPQYCY